MSDLTAPSKLARLRSWLTSPAPELRADIANTSRYIPSLDGLRAISVLIVMLSHFVTNMFPGGFGVYVFFVISGFLIARQFFVEQEATSSIGMTNFYLRRFFRLYPVALVFTATVVALYLAQGKTVDWWQPASALFYFSNYYFASFIDPSQEVMPLVIFWSLSVEEHFYLLFPTVFLLAKGAPRRLGFIVLGVIVGALALRLGMAIRHPELIGSYYFYYRSEFRMDSIAYGVGVAALCATEWGRSFLARLANPVTLVAAGAIVLFCLLYREPFFRETWRYSLVGLAIAAALVSVLFSARLGWVQRLLNMRLPVYIGKLSYSLYLWHFLVLYLTGPLGDDLPRPALIVLNFALSFAVSSASYHWLEVPFLKLRKRLHARRKTSPDTDVSPSASTEV